MLVDIDFSDFGWKYQNVGIPGGDSPTELSFAGKNLVLGDSGSKARYLDFFKLLVPIINRYLPSKSVPILNNGGEVNPLRICREML